MSRNPGGTFRSLSEEARWWAEQLPDQWDRAGREPWLVIDPKPLVGEREFGIAALVRGSELGSGPNAARRRFDRLTADLSLDGERARGWVVAQTLAWAFVDGEVDHDQVEVARAFVG